MFSLAAKTSNLLKTKKKKRILRLAVVLYIGMHLIGISSIVPFPKTSSKNLFFQTFCLTFWACIFHTSKCVTREPPLHRGASYCQVYPTLAEAGKPLLQFRSNLFFTDFRREIRAVGASSRILNLSHQARAIASFMLRIRVARCVGWHVSSAAEETGGQSRTVRPKDSFSPDHARARIARNSSTASSSGCLPSATSTIRTHFLCASRAAISAAALHPASSPSNMTTTCRK